MADTSQPGKWKTALTKIEPGSIRIRGVDVTNIMSRGSFADGIYLILKGEAPTPAHSRLMNAILISSIDHGLTPPSSLATRTVLSGGNPVNAAVAAGILTIGESHGGAIEACARMLQDSADAGRDAADVAAEVVADYKSRKQRVSGFGHRVHGTDPRALALVEMAEAEGLRGAHVNLALAVEAELASTTGRKLPLNVDGAIAAVISEMGFDWRLGKGFFIISRTPGLVAHAFEELNRERPMRKMTNFETEYDGPDDNDSWP